MGIEKGFKKETIYIINNNMSAENKINLNNINMYFKDFKGQNDFNVKIDPIKVNKNWRSNVNQLKRFGYNN